MKAKKYNHIEIELDLLYGPKGTPERENHDWCFELFKNGVMIHQTRINKDLTQQELINWVLPILAILPEYLNGIIN